MSTGTGDSYHVGPSAHLVPSQSLGEQSLLRRIARHIAYAPVARIHIGPPQREARSRVERQRLITASDDLDRDVSGRDRASAKGHRQRRR